MGQRRSALGRGAARARSARARRRRARAPAARRARRRAHPPARRPHPFLLPPDKLCDRVSDAVLDACLEQDPASKASPGVIGAQRVAHGSAAAGAAAAGRAGFLRARGGGARGARSRAAASFGGLSLRAPLTRPPTHHDVTMCLCPRWRARRL